MIVTRSSKRLSTLKMIMNKTMSILTMVTKIEDLLLRVELTVPAMMMTKVLVTLSINLVAVVSMTARMILIISMVKFNQKIAVSVKKKSIGA